MAYNSLDNKTEVINGREYQNVPDLSLPGKLGNCIFAAVHATDNGTDLTFLRLGPGQRKNVSLLVGNDGTFKVSEW